MIQVRQLICICFVIYSCVCLSQTRSINQKEGDIYDQVVAHPDRTAADRERDAGRKPAEIFRFLGLEPGMTVLELGSAGGYSTEIAARIVGADGAVYAQAFTGHARLRGNRLPNVEVLEPMLLWELRKKVTTAGLKAGTVDRILIFFALHDM